jgi:uncharacterized protein YeaO (DUF488 family)
MAEKHGFRVKRVYDPPERADGVRVLVDRLWPRGVKKEDAAIDEWAKEVAPSKELRTWFHADKEGRREEFARRYTAELGDPEHAEALEHLRELGRRHTVTLVTAVKDVDRSQIPCLLEQLRPR